MWTSCIRPERVASGLAAPAVGWTISGFTGIRCVEKARNHSADQVVAPTLPQATGVLYRGQRSGGPKGSMRGLAYGPRTVQSASLPSLLAARSSTSTV